ncbi:hypothetical protein V2J09_001540 [Rumex salicifolius]
MAEIIACKSVLNPMITSSHPAFRRTVATTAADVKGCRKPLTTTQAARNGGISLRSILKKCGKCEGKGAIECPGCKGTGRNKKNGNIFERWKCFDCQGFGLKGCPECKKGGLTPEQRGER